MVLVKFIFEDSKIAPQEVVGIVGESITFKWNSEKILIAYSVGIKIVK